MVGWVGGAYASTSGDFLASTGGTWWPFFLQDTVNFVFTTHVSERERSGGVDVAASLARDASCGTAPAA